MRTHRRVQMVVAATVLLGVLQGCSSWEHKRSLALATDNPHDTDSLYVLVRKMLKDEDPRPTYFAFNCEVGKIFKRLGDDAARRIDIAVDTALKTTDDRDRWHASSNSLAGSEFAENDSICAAGWGARIGDRAALPLRR